MKIVQIITSLIIASLRQRHLLVIKLKTVVLLHKKILKHVVKKNATYCSKVFKKN